jgi:hypothetical protein
LARYRTSGGVLYATHLRIQVQVIPVMETNGIHPTMKNGVYAYITVFTARDQG